MADEPSRPTETNHLSDGDEAANAVKVIPRTGYGGESSDAELPWEVRWREDTSLKRSRSRRSSTQSNVSSSVNLNTDANYAAATSVIHPLTQYHEKSMETVTAMLFITCALVAALCFLQLNIGWSVGVVSIATFSIRRRTDGIKDDYLAHMSRKRLEALQNPDSAGESAEWINSVMQRIWPILNPDIFSSLMELLQETMRKQSPAIVNSVRLEDLVLGSNALRVLSVKVLPDSAQIGSVPTHDEGDFISLEIEFSYRRLPPPSPKGSNTHFMAYFGMGPKIASFEVPVIVEVRGTIGRVRVRLQLISDPPFVRHAYISFPHMPELVVVANPLNSTIDLMNLPLLSQFVQRSMRDVLQTFTSPSWYAIDCSRLLVGSDVDVSPHSTGVICVVIHYAVDLSGTDTSYISVGLARFGKPLFSTRTIEHHDGDPHIEEIFYIRIVPDDADDDDHLRLTLWDSDSHHGDDVIGRVEVPLSELFQSPNTLQRQQRPLAQVHRRPKPHGQLNFSAGFFAIAVRDLHKAMRTSGNAAKLPPPLLGRPGDALSRAGLFSDRIKGALESMTPPDPELPSGILSIQIHQLENLEIPTARGVFAKRKHKHSPPSTYCQLFVNDDKVLQTRTKEFSANPYINASYEIFSRDWTTTQVRVVVLEHRRHEHDTVVGMVDSTLSELLQQRSQKTMWHSLVGGIGYGRLRMSVMFKSVAIALPRPLRSWDVGSLVIDSISSLSVPSNFSAHVEITLGDVVSKTSTAHAAPSRNSKGKDTLANAACSWMLDPPVRLPVYHRYSSAAIFSIKSHDDIYGESVLWLTNIVDKDKTTLRLPIYSERLPQLRQNNYSGIPPIASVDLTKTKKKNKSTTSLDHSEVGMPMPTGSLEVQLHFEPGLSSAHQQPVGTPPVETDEASRTWDLGGHHHDRPKSRVNFTTVVSPTISRTPTASQPNSRRSSWGEFTPLVDGTDDMKALSKLEKEEHSKSKIPKTVKWVKDGKKKLTSIGKSSKDSLPKTAKDPQEALKSRGNSESDMASFGKRLSMQSN